MSEDKICEYCKLKVRLNYPIKVWSEIRGNFYHNLCILSAIKDAMKYKKIDQIVKEYPDRYGPLHEIWFCSECGCYGGGYSCYTCRHCLSKQKDPVYWVRSNEME